MKPRKIIIKDPDYYYKAQHAIRKQANGNDLYKGHQIKIAKTGYWDGATHYGVFVIVYDRITGSESAVRPAYL